MVALRLFNYKTEPGGIGKEYEVGNHRNIVNDMTTIYRDPTSTKLQITSFHLYKGYGVKFFENPDFQGRVKRIYAPKEDVLNTFTGDNRYDRSMRAMQFEMSNDVLLDNVRSLQIFVLPSAASCQRPKISERDLCVAVHGENVIQTLGDQYRTPALVQFDKRSSSQDDYVPEDSDMTDAEAAAWLAQHSRSENNNTRLYVGLGIAALLFGGFMMQGSSKPRRRIRRG